MLPRLARHWRSWLFPSLLVFIAVSICYQNYTPRTWLTGWDTLHPEFDYGLHFSRLMNGVWREDQGLGAVAAHAHMSELPRLITLWLLDIFLPTSFVRYAYIFLCLILGPLGMYAFVSTLFLRAHDHKKNELLIAHFSAFLAALVYLFNLATVQQFVVIFEMFAVQFAALGWLFWSADYAIHKNFKHGLLLFSIISFLAAPMAYASTLWLATYAGVGLYLVSQHIFLHRLKKVELQKLLAVAAVTVCVNAFWLLPNIYFLLSPAHSIPGNSHINQLFSQEAFLQNREFGTFKDVAILKNFLFNWYIYDFETTRFSQLLESWTTHISRTSVLSIGYAIAGFAVIGVAFAIARKSRTAFLLPVFALSTFMLINANPPFTSIFNWLRTHSGLFEEGFRFPFTKFSFLFAFCLSIFASFTISKILSLCKNSRVSLSVAIIVIVCSTIPSLFWYGLPMFSGELISTHIQKQIPQDYFDFFSFMKTQPHDARLAVLPVHTPAGWEYQNWGYQGAGFIWFGIPQSVLVRDFDRWNPGNEDFYEQLSTAIHGKDVALTRQTIQKYQVHYLLLNNYIINPTDNNQASMIDLQETEEMLHALGYTKVWQSDHLRVLKTDVSPSAAFQLQNPESVRDLPHKMRKDPVYAQVGNYYETTELDTQAQTYPFAFLHATKQDNIKVNNTTDSLATIQLSAPLPANTAPVEINFPQLPDGSDYTVLAQLEFLPGLINIDFVNQNTIEIDSRVITLPQLPPISLDLPSELSRAIVQLGNTSTHISLGSKKTAAITLKTGEPITLLVFDEDESENRSLQSQFNTNPFEECWRGTHEHPYSSVHQKNGTTTIQFNDISVCQSNYLLRTHSSPYFAQISVPYSSDNNAQPYVCILSKNSNYNCLNYPLYGSSKSAEWTTVTEEVLLSPQDDFWINLKNVPSVENSAGSLSFKAPTVKLYSVKAFAQIEKDIWKEITQPIPISVEQTDQSNITLNFLALRKNALIDSKNTSFFQNCDLKQRGIVNEKIEQNSLVLTSLNQGVGCKSFSFPDISQRAPHLLSISGENKTGRSAKLYVYNQSSDHNDVEELLPSGRFHQYFSLLPWNNLSESGYAVTIENRSFGRIPSENWISSLDVYTLPLDWISQIRIMAGSAQKDSQMLPLKPRRYTNYLYTVQLNEKEQSVLTISQAYDSGWIAFANGNPFKRLEHVQVNGWANGWIVGRDLRLENSSLKDDNNQATMTPKSQRSKQPTNQSNIMILFWPQLLEFLGFAMMGVLGLVFLLKKNLN